jgi:hypothetical protein
MQFKTYIFAITAAIALVSCTEDINIDLGSVAPELVVDGAINTDTVTHTIYLKKTSDYFSNKAADVVSGATVTLSDGTSTITLAESSAIKGAYQTPSDYYGVVGRTYTLTITNVDVNGDGVKESYTASSTITTKPPLEKIDVHKAKESGKDVWNVAVWIQDPANEKNFYMAKSYKNTICISDSIQEWSVSNDEIYNGFYLENETFISFSAEKSDEILHNGDLITFELNGVSEDYYYFISEAAQEFSGRNPLFGGQPANIRTNIKQTAPANATGSPHGYFAAYSTSRKSVTYKE